jgi:hypothetical protein
MATIDLALRPGVGYHPTLGGNFKKVYVVQRDLNLATAAATKGTALAAADVIEIIDIPPHSLVLGATVQILAVMTGTSTDATIDVGVTGIDPDAFVDGMDLDAATLNSYGAQPAAYQPIVIGATGDTLDVLIATQTNTITGGILRVTAVIADVSNDTDGGLAQPKS